MELCTWSCLCLGVGLLKVHYSLCHYNESTKVAVHRPIHDSRHPVSCTSVYFFIKFLQVFKYLTRKNLHKNKMRVNWHTRSRIRHVVWLVKKKPHTLTDTLEIEMTYMIRHVTLRWHFGRKCRFQLTFLFVYENVTWHCEIEVEC